MDIPLERAQFIADIANDEWIGRLERPIPEDQFATLCEEWDGRRNEFLATASNPAELHLFADLWNWDGDDLAPLRKVLSRPNCQKATALLLFWRAQAEDFVGFGSVQETQRSYQDPYRFVREIQTRYLAGEFATGSLSYDPRKDYRLAGPERTSHGTGWRISPEMYEPVTGE